MRSMHNAFASLALRAGNGDVSAKAQLRRDLEPELIHIVRRVLQEGTRRSPLERSILAEAERLGLNADGSETDDGEFLVQQVARSVCSMVLAGVKPIPRPHYRAEDTVCT